MEVRVAGEAAHVSIRPLRRAYPATDDYWDANWIECAVSIETRAFKGAFEAKLRSDEFRSFRDQIAAMAKHLEGTASFDPMEPSLIIRGQVDRLGGIVWRCEANHPLGVGDSLRFSIESDQSYLRGLKVELDSLLEEFPVAGKP